MIILYLKQLSLNLEMMRQAVKPGGIDHVNINAVAGIIDTADFRVALYLLDLRCRTGPAAIRIRHAANGGEAGRIRRRKTNAPVGDFAILEWVRTICRGVVHHRLPGALVAINDRRLAERGHAVYEWLCKFDAWSGFDVEYGEAQMRLQCAVESRDSIYQAVRVARVNGVVDADIIGILDLRGSCGVYRAGINRIRAIAI